MSRTPKKTTIVRCACGSVELEATGDPIMRAACYCDDCQEGTRQIEALPGAHPVLGADGGTTYVIYRKDRVRCSKGAPFLTAHKLREGSVTNRVVATCCNSAMLLNFDDGKHWVDVYQVRFQGELAPLDMRVCTKFKPADAVIPDDVPHYPGYPFKFIAKLLTARAAMLLHL
jgi:hypothetical protein